MMFFRQINKELKVSLLISHDAQEVFELVDANRGYLEEWMPWVSATCSVEDTRVFIASTLRDFQDEKVVSEAIFYQNKIVGIAGLYDINKAQGGACVGYWLAKDYTHRGIMTEVVNDLLALGFDYYGLEQVYIECSTLNVRSETLAKRLGFKKVTTLHNASFMNGKSLNHYLYALTKRDFKGLL